MKRLVLVIFSICIMFVVPTFACTRFYVGKEVSDNGTTIIARTRDSNNMQKATRRVFNKRIENKKGRVYKEKINGFEMKLPDTTYQYISGPAMTAANVGLYGASCINEYGLAITATVTAMSNKKVLEADPFVKTGISEACIGDIVAMCCKTGREAVEFLGKVIKECGNAEPNVIMIADQNEAWLLETYTGHEWAAVKMPTNKIAIFGNQFMIDAINESYDEIICSENIEIMPKKAGIAIYNNGKFDIFNTYSGKEILSDYSQLRNWYGMYLFSREKSKAYNVKEKMPLFYEPNKKIGFSDIKEFYRSRYEGTEFCPDTNGRKDMRIVGTETQYSVDITEIYDDLPKEMSVVSWVCLDNAEHSVFIPFSNLLSGVSKSWSKDMVEKLDHEDDTTAYYAFQNLCVLGVEGRNSYGKGIRKYWNEVEKYLKDSYADILKHTKELYGKNNKKAIKYITDYSNYIQELSVSDARYITKEVMHYLALNQRTFDFEIDSESGGMKGRYIHPEFESDLLSKVDERYNFEKGKKLIY